MGSVEQGRSVGKTHIVIDLGGHYTPALKAVLNVEVLGNALGTALDSEGEQGRGQTTSVAEHADALALQVLAVDVGEQAAQAAVDTAAVHVTALGWDLDAGLDAGSKALLGEGHKCLLDSLVRDRSGVVQVAKLGWDLSKDGVGGVDEVVVVQQARVRLGYELAGRGMESHVVKAVNSSFDLVTAAVDAVAVLLRLERLLSLVVGLVAGIHCLGVAAEGEVSVDNGVFARKVGLVEVVCVPDVGTALASVHDNWRVGANKHGHASGSASRAGGALGVKGNVSCDDDGVTAVPARGLDPVDRVEQGVCAAVAGVYRVDTLDVVVARLLKQLHQDRFHRLGLVQQRLGADLEAADCLGVDVVLLEQRGDGGQGERVNVCGSSASALCGGHSRMAGTHLRGRRRKTSWSGRDQSCTCPGRRHRTFRARPGRRTAERLVRYRPRARWGCVAGKRKGCGGRLARVLRTWLGK